MALFRRKKNDNVLPEVEEYYQAERRDRGWLAWLLAILSVAVVVMILVGLFVGGRWAYRELTDEDEEVAVTENADDDLTVDGQTTEEQAAEDKAAADKKAAEDKAVADQKAAEDKAAADKKAAEEKAAADKKAQETAQNNGTVNAPAQTNTPSTGDSSGNTATTTPKTGDDPLPSTGSASLVGVFAGVSTLAGGIHYVVERRRQRS